MADTAISLRTSAPIRLGGGGVGTLDQLKFKVHQSDQVFIGGEGTLDQLKSKVPQPGQVCIFRGSGTLDQVKPEVPTSLTIFASGVGW